MPNNIGPKNIKDFFGNNSQWDTAFAVILAVLAIIFFILFVLYLRKQYIIRKRSVDTFTEKPKGNIEYPGFHMGKTRNVMPDKKDRKADKWGKIEDD